MKPIRKGILTAAALMAGVLTSSANVTVQAWWRFGEVLDYYQDSQNGHRLAAAYSHVPWNNPAYSGNFSGIITPTGIGGPLGTSGVTSTSSLRAGKWGTMICTMWNATGYVPPQKDWFMEIWVQPHATGHVWGGGAWIWTANSGRGLGLQVRDDGTNSWFVGTILDTVSADVGNPVMIDTNNWTHLALVNDNGVVTYYVNGVASGASDTTHAVSAPSGDVQFGRDNAGYDGLMDEARICSFDPGTFSTNYFLLRPPGPQILGQPENAVVWNGGAAPFTVGPVIDSTLVYQWQTNEVAVPGGSGATLNLPQVTAADSGKTARCILTSGGLSVTSSVVTLTVVTPNPADVKAYQDAVKGEPGVVEYFTADDCLGSTVINVLDPAYNGTLRLPVPTYDGRTNRVFGQRAPAFEENGDVAIPYNPAAEFSAGNGTVEAIVYLSHSTRENATLYSVADESGIVNLAIRVSSDGSSLLYSDSASGEENTTLSWAAPASLIGRKAHVALVFENTVNVTAYVDGQSLGTKVHTGFGTTYQAPAFIGSTGTNRYLWAGTIDELAVYTNALSTAALQTHYSRYVYGTNVVGPSIVSQPASKTLAAGAAPILSVKAAGTLPLSYQWTSNGVAVVGATSPQLTAKSTSGVESTATYVLWVTNSFGWTNTADIALTFVPVTSGYANAVLSDGPSSFWRLGEGSGTLAEDSAGFNDAAYSGGLTLGQSGAIGTDTNTAVKFSGGTAVAPYTPTLNPATPFAVEFYAKPDNSGQQATTVIGSQNRNVGRSGYAIYQGLNGNFWEVHMGDAGTVRIWMFGLTPVVAGQWYHVALVYDTSLPTFPARLYVNGVDDTDYANSYTTEGGNFLPNNSIPFSIGSRMAGTQSLFRGVIDEVAFYNYAVSGNQLSNHWSFSWFGSAITQQPVGVTNNELSTVTLTAAASGYPNTYQWYKNNVALDPAKTSFDGTAHYPGGVTSPTLTIAKPTTADAGQYHMKVINALGGAQTIDVTVALIITDTTPPVVQAAGSMGDAGIGYVTVDVGFDEILDLGGADPGVDPGTARDPANYTFVSPGASVVQSELRKDGKAVRLRVTGLSSTPGAAFTLKVANVRDWTRRPSNAIPAAGQTISGEVQGLITYTQDVGAPAVNGTTYTLGLGEYEAEAGGVDIWGASDSFHYAYREVTGDFDVSAQIVQVTTPGNRSGIMLREGPLGSSAADARFNYITWNPGNLLGFHVRQAVGGATVSANPQKSDWIAFGPTPNVWIRLQRVGDVTSAYYATDGLNWNAYGTITNIIADPALLGLATAANAGATTGFTKYANYATTVIHPKLGASYTGGQLTITWTGTGTLVQSTDVALPVGQWTVVPGNPSGSYTVTPATGVPQTYYLLRP